MNCNPSFIIRQLVYVSSVLWGEIFFFQIWVKTPFNTWLSCCLQCGNSRPLVFSVTPLHHELVPLLKVDVTSFLSSSPRLVSGAVHPPCCWILLPSVCLFDELSGLIHLPDFLRLILVFDVTTRVYFCACYTDVRLLKSPTFFLFAELNFSSAPRRNCLKYTPSSLFCSVCCIFSCVILLNCHLWQK